MAPVITYLTASLLLFNNVALCLGPQPNLQIAREATVVQGLKQRRQTAHDAAVVAHFGGTITSDPKGITKSWGGGKGWGPPGPGWKAGPKAPWGPKGPGWGGKPPAPTSGNPYPGCNDVPPYCGYYKSDYHPKPPHKD
ncbi:uncharacterized protein MYCFIDRAFT_204841 [Pseudocercospora fijiensis CIRAD86]|uniref:Uncharacterized protein n=1 Tax=Pseudocercospora fijiensis (strain CIRAD86) TaxID=383855 RepID=M2ZK63_PSEFD|nr:uncharacterized protein MYCFIDRAFT_204841 [Pseudocercospora fijiensis CIRAD86]EME79494.1 hypothetical protein MYCFIDRAFT_204841 [Pseudocercospora fijiensis CIRAD86]